MPVRGTGVTGVGLGIEPSRDKRQKDAGDWSDWCRRRWGLPDWESNPDLQGENLIS